MKTQLKFANFHSIDMKYLLIITLFFLSVSCGNTSEKAKIGYMESDSFEDLLEMPTTMQQPPPAAENTSNQRITKKVVKTGGISFESQNLETDYRKIKAILPKYNAYIENENQSKSDYRIKYSLTIRVPSTDYDTLLVSISSFADKLDHKYSNIEDVSERYYDLQTRIKNKKALETRYVELLKKAYAISDILEIERNLNSVRTDIENLQGQFNFLSKQVSLSTIQLDFYEVLPYVYESSNKKGFGARLLSALDNGWQGFLYFLVGLTSIWPFILLAIGLIYLFRFMRKRWGKKRK